MLDLNEFLSSVPDPMVVIRGDGAIAAANAAARELFGDWIEGRHHAAALRQPALLALIEANLGDQRKGGEAWFVATGQAGETRFRVTATPMTRGAAQVLMLHFSDVTHMREAEDMRRDFVANVSHELRSPLTAILGFVETLRGPASDDKEAQQRFLGIMEDEAQRMNRIVSDLLSLSSVEGQERMRPSGQVDLRDVVRAVAATMRPQASDTGNDLEIIGDDEGLPVTGDGDQLTQVVMNLVENAVKYGGPDRPVTLSLSSGNDLNGIRGPVARLDVIDRGEGIASVHLPRLTERFYRVDSHRSRAMGGTGLGLAIVKHIVNRHRGRLKVTSEPGSGSTFSVMLPMAGAGPTP